MSPRPLYIAPIRRKCCWWKSFSDTYSALVSALGQELITPGQNEFAVELIQHRESAPGILFKLAHYPSVQKASDQFVADVLCQDGLSFASIDCIFVPKEMGPVQFINTAERQAWKFQPGICPGM